MGRSGSLTSILLKVCSKLTNINARQHDRMEQDPFSIHCYFLDHIAATTGVHKNDREKQD